MKQSRFIRTFLVFFCGMSLPLFFYGTAGRIPSASTTTQPELDDLVWRAGWELAAGTEVRFEITLPDDFLEESPFAIRLLNTNTGEFQEFSPYVSNQRLSFETVISETAVYNLTDETGGALPYPSKMECLMAVFHAEQNSGMILC